MNLRDDKSMKTEDVGVRHPGVLAWLHLLKVHSKMERRSMGQLAEYDVTPAQFDVLAQLRKHPGINQQELSEHLLVTKGNVCGLINRMEERGWVARHSDPADRRINLLHLTCEGEALADKVVPLVERAIRENMSALAPEEQRELLNLLRELDRSLPY